MFKLSYPKTYSLLSSSIQFTADPSFQLFRPKTVLSLIPLLSHIKSTGPCCQLYLQNISESKAFFQPSPLLPSSKPLPPFKKFLLSLPLSSLFSTQQNDPINTCIGSPSHSTKPHTIWSHFLSDTVLYSFPFHSRDLLAICRMYQACSQFQLVTIPSAWNTLGPHLLAP